MKKQQKKSSGVVRIKPSLQAEVEKILAVNDNKIYCDSMTSFVNIAVRELLDSVKENDNKIRLDKK